MIEIHLVSDKYLQHCKSLMPDFFPQGMTNNVRFAFNIGDTTWAVYNSVLSWKNRISDTKDNI